LNDTAQDWINGLAGHVSILDTMMRLMARDAIFLVPLFLVAAWFWPAGPDRATNQRLAAAAFFSVLLALGFATVLGSIHYEARPFVSDLSTKLLISHGADNAFPSDHATVAFAIGGAIVWWRHLIGAVCLGIAVLIALARIYVGVHWPSDVIVAAAAGLLAGAILARVVPLFEKPQRWFSRFLPAFLISAP
jgi:undecaprenyl-diphosphatase